MMCAERQRSLWQILLSLGWERGLGEGMKNDFACDSILLKLSYEGGGYAEIRGPLSLL
jgi:hypothetical protein